MNRFPKLRMSLYYCVRHACLSFVLVLLSSCSFLPENGPGFMGLLGSHTKQSALQGQAPRATRVQLPEPAWEVTPEIEREVQLLLGRERSYLTQSLERREQYMPMLRQVFQDEGVPETLISMALIESGYNPSARSPAGAVGMWQFMRPTARMYGLTVTRHEDQRRDPILSTIAAARHLRDLYNIHQDWHLALAAYNAGSGGISRALRRAGADDYWTLVRKKKIPAQTARFVPRIIAVSLITKNMERYDLSTMAKNLDWLREGGDGSVQVARWSGDRRPSAG
jgi:hypothetical protein